MSLFTSTTKSIARSARRTITRSIESSSRQYAPTCSRATQLVASRGIHMVGRSGGPSTSLLMNEQRSRAGPSRMQARTMFIQTETTPNDLSLKFIPGVPVMSSGGTYEILSLKESLVSPLASRLMDVEGITSIFFGPDFVTVSKDETQPWNLVKPEIFSILMEHFTAGKPLFKEGSTADDGPQDTKVLDSDSEVLAMVKELLDTRVRPAIQEDGGDIEFISMDEESGVVKLKLKGSCRGCSSSSVTLKSGIERMLMHYVPEVKAVEQVLDAEELIALDEFAKFEKRLEKKGEAAKSSLEQYASH